MTDLPEYEYRGARAMVILHERHLRAFLESWQAAKAVDLALPAADDPDYASLEALLRHVLRCAGGYLWWICQQLGLPDPEIRQAPSEETIERDADGYVDHVLERWRQPLAGVPEDRFYRPEHLSRWGTRYCLDAMLEHAVMHPIRHRFQLEELMSAVRR